ncbi:bacterial Ig-like domain-containing protein [Isobaculum melis]|uniref:LPXTG-motif cell wall anchor domain-containing protein n=1 Tax=Isobaculum melis TaxID=142588 RepID=A0A1H9SGD0_9LACT|nr:bacterial Ig-like domain-containing protein [Isobaculum melis]SER83665.1 LPXTG-motif cell wall anchor domain-containing protein [Isobaculum melis]
MKKRMIFVLVASLMLSSSVSSVQALEEPEFNPLVEEATNEAVLVEEDDNEVPVEEPAVLSENKEPMRSEDEAILPTNRSMTTLFPDPNLAQAIASFFNKTVADELTVEEIQQTKKLVLGNLNIQSAKGIELFKRLEDLDLRGNQLVELPDELMQLTALEALRLQDNQLTKLPDNIGLLKSLSTLYLTNNQLTYLPDSFMDLAKLNTLFLSKNAITSLPANFFELPSLATVYLNENGLTKFPEATNKDSRVVELFANKNNFTYLPDNFEKFPRLKTLEVSWNQIEELPDSLTQLPLLANLHATKNNIAALPDRFTDLSSLVNLHLGNNLLTELPALSNFSKLKVLEVYSNRLTTLPTDIGSLSQLVTLKIDHNQLDTLPDSLAELTQLETLALHYNGLTQLPDAVFEKLIHLKSLNISYNQIANLPAMLTNHQLTQLTSLDIQTNLLPASSLDTSLSPLFPGLVTLATTNQDQLQLSKKNLVFEVASLDEIALIEQQDIIPFLRLAKGRTLSAKHQYQLTEFTDGAGNQVELKDYLDETGPLETATLFAKVRIKAPGFYQENEQSNSITEDPIQLNITADKSSLSVKDVTIYAGEAWTAVDNFIKATDKDGKEVPFSEVTVTDANQVDSQTPGEYEVTYHYGAKQETAKVTVLENQTSITVKDVTIYTGESWTAIDNFIKATDKDGKEVPFSEIIITAADQVDSQTPGEYEVTYHYGGKQETAKVIVLENQTSITVKDVTIYAGEAWTTVDNFVEATDKDGVVVSFNEITVTNAEKVDTQTPNEYEVTYQYGKQQAIAKVTVLANQTNILVKDTTIYVGETWLAEHNFVQAVDKAGQPVAFSTIEVEGAVDTSQVGSYQVTYRIVNQIGTYEKVATIQVIEPLSTEVEEGVVMIRYHDTQGNELNASELIKGALDSEYHILPKEIKGYQLKEEPANSNGFFTNKEQTVTFIYEKNEGTAIGLQPKEKEQSAVKENLPQTGENSVHMNLLIGAALLLTAGYIAKKEKSDTIV